MFQDDFKALGILPGDTVLMHSSMKALGTVLTPAAFLDELISYLGDRGTLLLPTFTYEEVTREHPIFSAKDSPSCVGLLTNTFRKLPGVIRSVHPTHSCAVFGFQAKELTEHHLLDNTPVGPHSPFRLLPEVGGKVLMLGPVNVHNTFLHGMEEIAGAPWCLCPATLTYTLITAEGQILRKDYYPHNFQNIRQCYDRIEALLPSDKISRGLIGKAPSTLMDTAAMQKAAVAKMQEDMYYFVDRI